VAERVEFKRNIGLFMAVMIGIGAMMGPGIFALPGELAKLVGPLGVLVYLAMGIVVVFTALNYAELGAALPIAGGGYSFVSRTLPKATAFLTGWFFWIGNVAACAMYVVIFALTIRAYFWPGASVPLIALIATAVFAAINLRGMSQALLVIAVMNLIELAVLIVVAIIGAFQIEAPNLQPFAPLGFGGFHDESQVFLHQLATVILYLRMEALEPGELVATQVGYVPLLMQRSPVGSDMDTELTIRALDRMEISDIDSCSDLFAEVSDRKLLTHLQDTYSCSRPAKAHILMTRKLGEENLLSSSGRLLKDGYNSYCRDILRRGRKNIPK